MHQQTQMLLGCSHKEEAPQALFQYSSCVADVAMLTGRVHAASAEHLSMH
jgi:hypothetical protein